MPTVKTLCIFILLAASAQDWRSYEQQLEKVATHAMPAVVAVLNTDLGVIRGSAFFINEDGYFLTAAHVLKEYTPHSGRVVVTIRLRDESGSGKPFDVVEKDEKLDVALCKINGYAAIRKDGSFNVGSLELSSSPPTVGRLVVIAGFPLGSWNPAVQAGHIAADHTMFPVAGIAYHLFQVSVGGNQGDSGGPVIDFGTGKVIGITLIGSLSGRTSGQGITLQSSGLMYAVPISKISEMLTRHNIAVEGIGAAR